MTEPVAPAPPEPERQPDADHHGLIVFLGVLAFILLFVGAVAAAGLAGGLGSRGDGEADGPGQAEAR